MEAFGEGVSISEPGVDMPAQLGKLHRRETDSCTQLTDSSLTTKTLGFQPNGFTQDPIRIRGHQAIMWGGVGTTGKLGKAGQSQETLGWTLGCSGRHACHRASNSLHLDTVGTADR